MHTRYTRNKNKLNILFSTPATGQQSFSYRATQLWHNLPERLPNIESFNVFKTGIKGRALMNFKALTFLKVYLNSHNDELCILSFKNNYGNVPITFECLFYILFVYFRF